MPSPLMARLHIIESGTDYLASRLASQAQSVLATHPVNAADQRQVPAATSGATSQLQSCVYAVTGGLSPLLVDKAHYQGQPATIIVAPPTASRPARSGSPGPPAPPPPPTSSPTPSSPPAD